MTDDGVNLPPTPREPGSDALLLRGLVALLRRLNPLVASPDREEK